MIDALSFSVALSFKVRVMMYILITLFLVSSVKFYLKRMCLLKS